MTRQKKEIIRKIDQIHKFIEIDQELGCGFAPVDFYDPLYDQIWELHEELSRLRHFDSYRAEMDFDMNLAYNMFDSELPFM